METIYKIGIIGIIFLGIAHSLYTFKKYKKLESNALWFFSATLGLIFSGLINYTNLILQNQVTFIVALAGNILLTLFSIVLTYTLRIATTFMVLFFALILLFGSIFFII